METEKCIKVDYEGELSIVFLKINEENFSDVIFREYFECDYCHNNIGIYGVSSVGPFYINSNVRFVIYSGGYYHLSNCKCPINSASCLYDLECGCGKCSREEIRGQIYFRKVKSTGPVKDEDIEIIRSIINRRKTHKSWGWISDIMNNILGYFI